MDPLQRKVCQIKDLSEQGELVGPLIVIAANGQASPINADDFTVTDGLFVAYRGEHAIYACPVDDARFYHVDVLDIKSWEVLQRETVTEMQAKLELAKQLAPEDHRIVRTQYGVMTEAQAKLMGLTPAPDNAEAVAPGQYL